MKNIFHKKTLGFFVLALVLLCGFYFDVNEVKATGFWIGVGEQNFSKGEISETSFLLDSNDTPYMAFRDVANDNKATVMKYNGSAWVNVGSAGFSSDQVDYTTIAFDSINTPYVTYRDVGNSGKTTVMKYNGSAWVNVGSAGFSAGDVHYTYIAIDSNDIPYVSYQDGASSYKATVMKYNGSSWVNVGTSGFSAGLASQPFLAIDSSDVPYVAYRDDGNDSKATVMKYNGSAWVDVGSAGFTSETVDYTTLAFDSNDQVYLAYKDTSSYKSTVKKFDGEEWVNVGSAGFSAGQVYFTSIALNSEGIPYVAYVDAGNSNKSTVMKLSTTPIITAYSGGFRESNDNDGSISGSRVVNLVNDTFTHAGSTLTEGVHYTLTNKPAGLTPVMTINGGGTTATLTFTGNATSHATTSNISNLGITFLNGAFTDTPTASDVEGYTNSSGSISFITPTYSTVALYGVDGAGGGAGGTKHLFTLDPLTGEKITDIGDTGYNITGIAFHPTTGVLYGVTGGQGSNPKNLFTISTTTGVATRLGAIKNSGNTTLSFPDISFRSNGVLYGMTNFNDDSSLYIIDPTSCNGTSDTNCLATLVGDSGLGTDAYGNGLAFDSTDQLYFFGDGDNTYYTIDPDDGSVLSNPDFSNPSGSGFSMNAATFDGADTLYVARLNYGSEPSDLVTIDTSTHTITSMGETTDMQYMDAIAFLLGPLPPEEEEEPEPTPTPTSHSSSGSRSRAGGGRTTPVQTPSLPIPTQTQVTSPTPIFTRDLKLGSIGEDVLQLQKYLNTHGFPVSLTGSGSTGNEIPKFGPLTKLALSKFQAAKGILPSVGYFGPKTRGYINLNN